LLLRLRDPTIPVNVELVCITDFSFLVPSPHRVDGFRKFRAAVFVDATGVDPNEAVTVFKCLFASMFDLEETLLDDPVSHRCPLDILEEHLILSDMR
jgi:hypothetical protein